MPAEYTTDSRRRQLDLLASLNNRHARSVGDPPELIARIRSYEMAFRMQASAPELFDIARESQQTQDLYGVGRKETAEMGRNCLLARRLVEAGVRFVQIRYGGWDAHKDLEPNHRRQSAATDQPIAALLADLRQRGMLDETLVIWGAEFGRTPTMEGKTNG